MIPDIVDRSLVNPSIEQDYFTEQSERSNKIAISPPQGIYRVIHGRLYLITNTPMISYTITNA